MYARNQHVDRLVRHSPLRPNHNDLYDEHSPATDARIRLKTKALDFVASLLRENGVRLVVLTGDAGHGKTHLCRRLVEDYGYSPEEALEWIKRKERTGIVVASQGVGDSRRPLRIVNDLSEIEPVEMGGHLLAEILADKENIGIVCANEGRLRAAIAGSGRSELDVLLKTLDAGIREGRTTLGGGIHVVNLNFQRLTVPENCILDELLRRWVDDGRSWRVCDTCEAAVWCPVLSTRNAFVCGEGTEQGNRLRREAFVQLIRTIECIGYVLTMRECLMLVSFLVTGDMDCGQVEDLHRRGKLESGKSEYLSNLFERRLPEEQLNTLPVLRRIRLLDPGLRAMSDVDHEVCRAMDKDDVHRGESLGRFASPPRTTRDLRLHAERQRQRVRRGRREDFFGFSHTESIPDTPHDREAARARRLGYRYFEDYLLALEPDETSKRRLGEIRDRLVDGLHILQGIRPKAEMNLAITDPAFARGAARAPIVARRIPRTDLEFMTRPVGWVDYELCKSVDWLASTVVLRLGKAGSEGLELGLDEFELVMRASGGIAFRGFHAAEVRRILRRLAKLVAVQQDEENILIMSGSSLLRLSIDNQDFVVGEP